MNKEDFEELAKVDYYEWVDFLAGGGYERNHFDLQNLDVPNIPKFIEDLKIFLPRAYSLDFVKGKKLLVIGENGYGDCIWFYRFVLELNKIADVYFFINEKVKDLFPDCKVITTYPDLRDYDCYVWAFDLLYLFRSAGQTSAYLKADPILEKSDKFRIGFALGNTDMGLDMIYRNVTPDLTYYFKDYGELYNFSNIPNKYCTHLFPLKSFTTTAGYIQSMDLMICADNVNLQLAGALGKRTIAIFPGKWEWIWWGLPEKIVWYDSIIPVVVGKNESAEVIYNKVKPFVKD